MELSTDRARVDWRLPLAVALAAYSWLATGLRAFTLPIDLAVGVPVLIVLGLSWRRSRLGYSPADALVRPAKSGLAAWAALTAVLTAWELAAYMGSPRHAHPTLSSISDDITSGHAARAVVFALWVILGCTLFLRRSGHATGRA